MKKIAAVAFVLLFLSGISVHAAVTFDWATVGNPGNGPDDTGFSAVSYVYRISKHEVHYASEQVPHDAHVPGSRFRWLRGVCQRSESGAIIFGAAIT